MILVMFFGLGWMGVSMGVDGLDGWVGGLLTLNLSAYGISTLMRLK